MRFQGLRRWTQALLAASALAGAGVATADTLLQIQQFDSRGTPGAVSSWTSADATFSAATRSDGGVSINMVASVGLWNWTLLFSPRTGQSLTAGLYDNAAIAPTAALPGLSVYNGPTGCAASYGQFTVRELVVVGGALSQFAADFEFHCNGDNGQPIVGGVRINSAVPYVPQGLAPLPPASLQVAGQTEEWVSHGFNGTLTRGAVSNFSFRLPSSGELDVQVRPADTGINGQWTLWFAAPSGAALAPGFYENAVTPTAPPQATPAIRVISQYTCLQTTGRFHVIELELGPMNRPIKLAIDFEQHCEGAPPPLYGALRLNSNAPFNPGAFPTLPSSMRAIGETTLIARLGAGSVTGPAYQAFDASGNPMPNTPIRFRVPASCGNFAGGTVTNVIGTLTSQVDVTTNASGIAVMPPYTPASATLCYAQALLLGATADPGLIITLVIWDPASISISPPIALTTDAGQPFRVSVRAIFQNFAIPHVPISAFVSSSTGAGATLPTPVETDARGVANFDAVANEFGGAYAIMFSAGGTNRVSTAITQRGPAAPPGTILTPQVQDMWWSGPAESGWGMSVVQHGDMLFNVIFVYDLQGNPTWYVMPGGAWNAARTAFQGMLYRPRGSPYTAYDASRFLAGQPVGTATITFSDANFATMQYIIDGGVGTKLIERQRFGTGAGGAGAHADMWWGGIAQNGWGLAVLEQSPKIFPIWYTYDASGNPRWFVMPIGEWTSSSVYEGRIYRTTGSPWVGRDYDRTQLRASDAGSFALRFDGDNARFDYSIDGANGSIPLQRQPF